MNYKLLFCLIFLFLYGCADDCNKQCLDIKLDCDCCPQKDSTKNQNISHSISNVNIFIETSGSMKGYMPKNTDIGTSFQKLIPDILLRLKGEYANVNLYSIYDSKSSFKKLDIDSARKNLIAKGGFTWSGSTYIPIMLDSIVNYLDSNSVNIFISDLIYSPEKSQITLTDQSISDIREIFRKIARGYSTSIYNLNSIFTDSDNNKSESPYYIVIEGKSNNLRSIESLFLKSFNTYKQSYNEIHFGNTNSNPFYTILPYSNNSGNFISYICDTSIKSYSLVKDIDISKETQFTVGLDFSSLPQYSKSKEYIEKNISLSIGSKDIINFKILAKEDLKNKLNNDDITFYEKCTYFIQVNLPNLETNVTKLDISLFNTRPDWVIANNDSIKVSSEKTYGLENIITGIEQAYESNNNSKYLFKNIIIPLIKE